MAFSNLAASELIPTRIERLVILCLTGSRKGFRRSWRSWNRQSPKTWILARFHAADFSGCSSFRDSILWPSIGARTFCRHKCQEQRQDFRTSQKSFQNQSSREKCGWTVALARIDGGGWAILAFLASLAHSTRCYETSIAAVDVSPQ